MFYPHFHPCDIQSVSFVVVCLFLDLRRMSYKKTSLGRAVVWLAAHSAAHLSISFSIFLQTRTPVIQLNRNNLFNFLTTAWLKWTSNYYYYYYYYYKLLLFSFCDLSPCCLYPDWNCFASSFSIFRIRHVTRSCRFIGENDTSSTFPCRSYVL